MDRGAWRVTVHGVAKCQTRLSDRTTTGMIWFSELCITLVSFGCISYFIILNTLQYRASLSSKMSQQTEIFCPWNLHV